VVTEVYIGKVKSEKFDFDAKGDWSGYTPEPLCDLFFCNKLYWDIVSAVNGQNPKTKQTDWGCFVIKFSKSELISYLDKDKYKKSDKPADSLKGFDIYAFNATTPKDVEASKAFLQVAKGLPDNEEYLLVAIEGISWEEDEK